MTISKAIIATLISITSINAYASESYECTGGARDKRSGQVTVLDPTTRDRKYVTVAFDSTPEEQNSAQAPAVVALSPKDSRRSIIKTDHLEIEVGALDRGLIYYHQRKISPHIFVMLDGQIVAATAAGGDGSEPIVILYRSAQADVSISCVRIAKN